MSKGQRIFDAIMSASAILINNAIVTFPNSDKDPNDPVKEILKIAWVDSDGLEFSFAFTKDDLEKAIVKKYSIDISNSDLAEAENDWLNIKLLTPVVIDETEIKDLVCKS